MPGTFKTLVAMLVVFAATANAADLVSAKLCAEKDFDSSAKECAAGKAMEGANIMINMDDIKTVYFLTAVKADKPEDVYHVWISNGKTAGAKVIVYDSSTKTMRDADGSDLDWLKERNIEGAQLVVKLVVKPSPRYRTRSQKTFGPRAVGHWKVQIYDSSKLAPLGEVSFTATRSDKGVSNENQ